MSFYNQDSVGGSFVGFQTTDPLALQNAGRLDFLESTIQTNGVDETTITGILNVNGSVGIQNNLDIGGNVSISGIIDSDLYVNANLTCNRLFLNGTNQNTYLDAEEITYDDPNANQEKLSIFFVEQSVGSNIGLLQPVVMQNPQSLGGASPQNRVAIESQRQCFSLTRNGSQNFTLRFNIPNLTTGNIQIPAVEHYFVFNKPNSGDTTITLQPYDDSGNLITSQLWALSTYKQYNTTGSLVNAGASTLTNTTTAFPTISSFKGFITMTIKSISNPNGQGALCFQSEVWEQP